MRSLWSLHCEVGRRLRTSFGNLCVFEEVDSKLQIIRLEMKFGNTTHIFKQGIYYCTKGCSSTCGNLGSEMNWVKTEQNINKPPCLPLLWCDPQLCVLLLPHSCYWACGTGWVIVPASEYLPELLQKQELAGTVRSFLRFPGIFSPADVFCIKFKFPVSPMTPSLACAATTKPTDLPQRLTAHCYFRVKCFPKPRYVLENGCNPGLYMHLETPDICLSGLWRMVFVLAWEVYCIPHLLISFLILVSHIPLFVLVPGHSLLFYFLAMFLLVLGGMSSGGHGAFPGVGSASWALFFNFFFL